MPKAATQPSSTRHPAPEHALDHTLNHEHRPGNEPAVMAKSESEPQPETQPQSQPGTEMTLEPNTGPESQAGATGQVSRKRGRNDDGSDDNELGDGHLQGRAARRRRTSYTSSLLLLGCGVGVAAGFTGFALSAWATCEPAATCLKRLFTPYVETVALTTASLLKDAVSRSRTFVG